jgi:hypothetical protein
MKFQNGTERYYYKIKRIILIIDNHHDSVQNLIRSYVSYNNTNLVVEVNYHLRSTFASTTFFRSLCCLVEISDLWLRFLWTVIGNHKNTLKRRKNAECTQTEQTLGLGPLR